MLDGMNFNLNGTSVFLKFLGSEYPKFGVFDGEEIYSARNCNSKLLSKNLDPPLPLPAPAVFDVTERE